jgi:ADP-heptose:LPS heptosyltransferase/tetratricopeptide (TPR) repeat protein
MRLAYLSSLVNRSLSAAPAQWHRRERPSAITICCARFGKRKRIIRDADTARDAREYVRAALLYEKALRFVPEDAAIHIQCGHMFKEAGDLARAELHYLRANKLTPNDPDLALQLGHFHNVAGRPSDAERSYKRAMELDPTWPEPAIQLAMLYRTSWRNRSGAMDKGLVPELAPLPPESKFQHQAEEIAVRSLGHRERTRWGVHNTLRGVDSIRGFCISAAPILALRGTLNGLRFYSGRPGDGYPLKYAKFDSQKRKYVFNIWHDFSSFDEGLYNLQLEFVDANGGVRVQREQVVIGATIGEDRYPESDQLVSPSTASNESLEEQINSRPSMIRPASRVRLPMLPRTILILRADQLGDMVVSIPAIRRLRELVPKARLVGLVSFANAELANTLHLFDEFIAIDFPDDEWERRRVMPLEEQHKLRRRLEPFKFDVAIDLAESPVSRPLLLLSGAPFLFGFKDDQAPWLSAFYEGWMVDPMNGRQAVPISVKTMGLVEWFGAILSDPSQIIRRNDPFKDQLMAYGLAAGDRFAVLHTGARLRFSQWPYYDQLAAMILEKTDLKVVMMSDEPATRHGRAAELTASGRFHIVDKQVPFDDFDALLSFCTVFVGNDSGPGHLASLRGANVITVFMARHNWNEWGHENKGYIVSRRVPCAGCDIHHDPEECGKGYACIMNILPEEVFRTVMEFV